MGHNSPSFLGIWKKDDITGDVDGWRYPLASSSSNHFCNACLFFSGSGYILQLIESGVLGLNSIVWSHGHDGGKQCDSSSLNTQVCCWYSSGISTFGVLCWAARASKKTSLVRGAVYIPYFSRLTKHPWSEPHLFSEVEVDKVVRCSWINKSLFVGHRVTCVKWNWNMHRSIASNVHRVTITSPHPGHWVQASWKSSFFHKLWMTKSLMLSFPPATPSNHCLDCSLLVPVKAWATWWSLGSCLASYYSVLSSSSAWVVRTLLHLLYPQVFPPCPQNSACWGAPEQFQVCCGQSWLKWPFCPQW